MPTVIDSLVVTLGLDAAQFKKGQADTQAALGKTRADANKLGKDMEADGKRAAQFFAQVKTEALALVGVLLGSKAIETFAHNWTKSVADLGRAARQIDMPAQQLAAFTMAIEANGGSVDGATSSLKAYSAAAENMRLHGAAVDQNMASFMNIMNIGPNDKPFEAYMKFVRFVEQHKNDKNGVQYINQAGAALHFDQGIIDATLRMGSVAKAAAEMREAIERGAPTAEQVKAITDMESALLKLQQAVSGDWTKLKADLAPGIIAVSDAITELLTKHPQAAEGIMALTLALSALATIKVATDILGFVTGMGVAVGTLTSRLALALRLLGGLGLGGALLYEGLHPGSTNDNEDALMKKWREDHPNDGYKAPGQSLGPSENKAQEFFRDHAPEALGGRPKALGSRQFQSREAMIRDRLAAELGITTDAAAGIVSNLVAESGLVPGIEGQLYKGQRAIGLAQWFGPRRKEYEKYRDQHGGASNDEVDLGFLVKELKENYPDLLAKLRTGTITPYQAANLMFNFESGGAPSLEQYRYGHVVDAPHIAGFPSTPPPPDAPGQPPRAWDTLPLPLPGPIPPIPPDPVAPNAAPQPPDLIPPNIPGPSDMPLLLGMGATSNNTTHVQVGDVTVHSAATDASGIARDMRTAIRDQWVTQANRGLV